MSDGFTKQFAIRLPNGELWTQCRHSSIFGGSHEREVVVFDTREQAEGVIAMLAKQVADLGVSSWGGWVEQRVCSPFSMSDPSEAFADEVTKWAAQQGGGE